MNQTKRTPKSQTYIFHQLPDLTEMDLTIRIFRVITCHRSENGGASVSLVPVYFPGPAAIPTGL